MSYARVYEEYWDGRKIEPLSDRAALLGLFLLTGLHRNAIGCFRLGTGAITDIPRFGAWGIEGVSKALQEMVETGFIVRDDRTGWTLIVNYLKKDPINNYKAAIHAAGLADRVPRDSKVYQELKVILEPQLEPHAKHLEGKPGYPMASPIEAPSEGHTKPHRSPLPIPSPSPEPVPTSSLRSDAAGAAQADGRDHRDHDEQLDLGDQHRASVPATTSAVPTSSANGQHPPPAEAEPPPDLKTAIFRPCLAWLCRQGNLHEGGARSFLGRCIRDYGEGATLQAIVAAQRGSPIEPIAYIRTVLANDRGKRQGSDDSERLLAELEEALG